MQSWNVKSARKNGTFLFLPYKRTAYQWSYFEGSVVPLTRSEHAWVIPYPKKWRKVSCSKMFLLKTSEIFFNSFNVLFCHVGKIRLRSGVKMCWRWKSRLKPAIISYQNRHDPFVEIVCFNSPPEDMLKNKIFLFLKIVYYLFDSEDILRNETSCFSRTGIERHSGSPKAMFRNLSTKAAPLKICLKELVQSAIIWFGTEARQLIEQ